MNQPIQKTLTEEKSHKFYKDGWKDFMKKLILPLVFLVILAMVPSVSADPILDKQNALLEKDKKNREKILAKYDLFYARIQKRFPELNFKNMPMDPSFAKDVVEHNDPPGGVSKKFKSVFSYAAENFILKSEPNLLPKFNLPFKVRKGEKVEVVFVLKNDGEIKKDQPHWCLVRTSNKKEGYILSEYLLNSFPSSKETMNSKKPKSAERRFFDPNTGEISDLTSKTDARFKDKTFWVNASSLNVRENPDVNSVILDRIIRGEKLKVILSTNYEDNIDGISDYWHQIEGNSGRGWVFGGYLSASEIEVPLENYASNETSFPIENPEDLKPGTKRYVRSVSLRMRDEPNDFGTVITSIPGDERVKIIDVKPEIETLAGVRSKWIYISWEDTWEGWIFGGFVSKDKGPLVENDDISKYFQMPVDNDRYVSSAFGTRVDPVTGKVGAFHSGIDLPANIGTPIRAVNDGKVWKTITTSGGYGVLTILSHKNNIYTYYAHQNQRKVSEGEVVKSGDVIGEVGNTGKSTGPHLHFEVRKGPSQQALDPSAFLPR